jgi:hypothetical protein
MGVRLSGIRVLLLTMLVGAAGALATAAPEGALAAVTQCSDHIDNRDREDRLADARDPGCHTDGDASNEDSYNPKDRSEANSRKRSSGGSTPPPPATDPMEAAACRASVLRIGTFEPIVANSPGSPCNAQSAGLPTFELIPSGPRLVRVGLPRADADDSGSSASTAHFDLWDPTVTDPEAFPLVHAELLAASTGCNGEGAPDGSSRIGDLAVAGQYVEVAGPEPQEFAAGPFATVYTNQKVTGDDAVTVRALVIDTHGPLETLVGDIVVAEASFAEHPDYICPGGGSRGH